MSELIPAATAVLIRDGQQGLEVLLLRRSMALSFAPGLWAFPGGRVELEDKQQGQDEMLAAQNAAVRETKEETGLTIAAKHLTPLSHWLPPKSLSKRFATHFFVSQYIEDTEVRVDQQEIDLHQWCTAQQALEQQRNKTMPMMAPTFITLSELAQFATVAEALSFYQNREPFYYAASDWRSTENGRCMMYRGDAGYDCDDASVPGARHRLCEQAGVWRYQCSF